MNFDYLQMIPQMNSLYCSCREAERFVVSDPSISASAARRSIEYLVKLVYSSSVTPYIEGLGIYDMLTDPAFTRHIDDQDLINTIHVIRKAGNRAVHEGNLNASEAQNILKKLHYVVGEICVFLGLVNSYPDYRYPSQSSETSIVPMSPVELEISQSFVVQLHKQLLTRSSYTKSRKLINVHVDPRKQPQEQPGVRIDPGANSKTAFQDVVAYLKRIFPNYTLLEDRTKCIVSLKTPSGKTVSISVKSGCSQLSSTENGEVKLLPGIDFIVYAPDFAIGKDALSQLRVFSKDEFLEMWNSLGLIRKKVSTAAMNRYREQYGPSFKTSIDLHADVISVQSFSNSGKKSKLVHLACEDKPKLLNEGIERLRQFLK